MQIGKDTISCAEDKFVSQIKDAIRDGLRAIKNGITDEALVPGAGAFQIACADHLRDYAEENVKGKARLGVTLLGEALLGTVRCLAKNGGFDAQVRHPFPYMLTTE